MIQTIIPERWLSPRSRINSFSTVLTIVEFVVAVDEHILKNCYLFFLYTNIICFYFDLCERQRVKETKITPICWFPKCLKQLDLVQAKSRSHNSIQNPYMDSRDLKIGSVTCSSQGMN